ncbi:terpene synthase family protein [Sphaerisporangium rhizosphaerae]|uniref:Terpene synthase n=1 Tax=Sphaerisporangium rhizosphaerae TaxID=2269375 RepID=A0ABW2P8L0_9ACTN
MTAPPATVDHCLDVLLPTTLDVFPPLLNEHLRVARDHLSEWVVEHDLVRKPAARRRFEHADFAWFAAVTYPAADERGLCLIADWFAWLFLLDDQFDDGAVGRDPARVQDLMGQLAAVLLQDGDDPGTARPAIVAALADLWRRTIPRATPAWRDRFVHHIAEGGAAAMWEAGNRTRGLVPDEATYITKRRHTGAIYVCMDLIEPADLAEVPAAVYDHPAYQDALRAACDVVCWTNDVFSLEKELSVGEYHNLVPIVERARGLTRAPAVQHVVSAIAREVDRFLLGEREALAALPGHAAEAARNFAGMRSWMRGNLDWSARTKRYRDAGEETAHRPADYLDALAEAGT